MKYFIYFLLVSASALLVYNASLLDFNHLLSDDGTVALVGVIACLCVILLMLILLVSRAIKTKSEEVQEVEA